MRIREHENTRHSGGTGSSPTDCRPVVQGGLHIGGGGALRGRVGVEYQALETGLGAGGEAALAARPPYRQPCRLSDEQKGQLVEILVRGPLAAGYFSDLWTLRGSGR